MTPRSLAFQICIISHLNIFKCDTTNKTFILLSLTWLYRMIYIQSALGYSIYKIYEHGDSSKMNKRESTEIDMGG